MLKIVNQHKLTLCAPPRTHDVAIAAQGPEFHYFSKQHIAELLRLGTKLLAPHLGGSSREELPTETGTNSKSSSEVEAKDFVKIGAYHTPKQFLSLATELQHPLDATDHLEPATKYALQYNLRYPAELIKIERRKNFLYASSLQLRRNLKSKLFMTRYLRVLPRF